MVKQKVFIILTHKHRPKPGTDQWEVDETVEFVNQIRNRHTGTASVIADYINKRVIVGSRVGMSDYEAVDRYVRIKYPNQMSDIDTAYGHLQKKEEKDKKQSIFVDKFGNTREKTVFDI